MFPSKENPSYGSFVKTFVEGLEREDDIKYKLAVIRGKKRNLFKKASAYWKFFHQASFLLRSRQFDLTYVHYANHSLLPLLLVDNKSRGRFIVNFHGSDVFPENLIASLVSKLTAILISKALRVVVPSEPFAQEVTSRYKVAKTEIFISPSGGIDTEKFRRSDSSRYSGEINKKLNVAFLSRLDFGKGLEVLLHSLTLLKAKDIKIKLDVGGTGSLHSIFQEKVSELEIQDEVCFHGHLDPKTIPQFFQKSDVFVFPSYRKGESLGLVGLEAMAAGLPVIGSNIPSIASYVESGVSGYLFDPQNPSSLANRLEEFTCLTANERCLMSRNAILTAERYDRKIVQKSMSFFLRSIYQTDKT